MVEDWLYPLQQLAPVFFHGCFIETFTNTFCSMPWIKLMFYIIKAWIHSHQFANLWMPVSEHNINFYFIYFQCSSNLKAFSRNYWNELNIATLSNSPILNSLIWKLWNLENVVLELVTFAMLLDFTNFAPKYDFRSTKNIIFNIFIRK